MESFCISNGGSHSGYHHHHYGKDKKSAVHHVLCNRELNNKKSSCVRSRPTTLPVVVIAICLMSRGDALSFSPSSSSSSRFNSIAYAPLFHRYTYPSREKYHRYDHLYLRSKSSSSSSNHERENQQHSGQMQHTNSISSTTPFNHDIARTLFAPLFFSLYHYKSKDLQHHPPSGPPRHQYTRPSPFEDPSCAQTAERMLRRMMENRQRSEGRTVCPDSRTFGLVAGAYGRLRWKQGRAGRKSGIKTNYSHNNSNNMVILQEEVNPVDKLQGLLQLQLRLCHQEGWSTEIRPTVDMYNRVLKRLAKQSGMLGYQGNNRSAEQALLWLQLMRSPIPHCHDSDEKSEVLCNPDAMTYAHVIDALSSHRDPAPTDSEKLDQNSLVGKSFLATYESMHDFAKQIDVDMITCENRPRAPTSVMLLMEAEALLDLLEDEYNKKCLEDKLRNDQVERALAHAYKCLAEGWGRHAVLEASTDIVTRKNQGVDAERSDNEILPNREKSINRSHELLSQLEELCPEYIPSSCYSSVILALSTSNSPTAASLAEGVLERMITRYVGDVPSQFFNAKDVSKAFSGCIAAHAKNNDAPKAENVLNQMIDLYYDGTLGPEFSPEVRAFGECIALWGKYNDSLKVKSKMRKEQRLHNADRAESILTQMECIADNESYKDNKKFALDATPYNIAILARVQTIDIQPDGYNSEKQAENERIILHAQSILDRMENERRVLPDPYTYSILLHAWCQQSRPGNEKAADNAEELLRRRIEDVDTIKILAELKSNKSRAVGEIWPNVKHYSSVLKAHAKTKSPGGAKKALALLCEMERRYYDADLVEGTEGSDSPTEFHVDQKNAAKPDLVCYSIVIDAFAHSRLPEASTVALRLLRAVETKYDAGDESMKPNTRIYTAVILSLVHSPFSADEDDDKRITNNAQKAWSILEKMKKNQIPPNSFTYNYIINAAAESAKDQRSSFEVAVRAFQELRMSKTTQEIDMEDGTIDPCHPDSFTYSFMIKACNNLLPKEPLRTKVIYQVFRECCNSGYLNDAILDRVWRGLSSEEFNSLVEKKIRTISGGDGNKDIPPKSPIQVDALPSSWSRCSCKQHSRRDATTWQKGVKIASLK